MQIYLDYSATTPPHSEVIALMSQIMAEQWGNPSSTHTWGERSATVVEKARMQVSSLLNVQSDSIVFTSGGTEANNLAVLGVASLYDRPQHIITSSVEHSAISKPIDHLERQGWQITRLPVNRLGQVDPRDFEKALRPNTVLITVIYGQSEVGTIQPISELVSIVQHWRTQHHSDVIFHTDAVQVAGRLPLDLQHLPVDLLSLSSHKFYGPQGCGALYVRPGLSLVPLLHGGGQEFQLRSGTQAVPAIAGFGLAAELAAQNLSTEASRLQNLRDQLFANFASHPTLMPTGDRIHRLPHHVSFCLRPHTDLLETGITGKTIAHQMSLAGIGISSGSACDSGKTIPSPTLLAMGFSEYQAKTGIRLTLGRDTTADDI
ncbi:MAG: cysteine desulfurase, partial [Cyanobacteria bacterium]|nr:cysteine desulfurase [Cyanobacteriota bacterium]MDW8202192.1 cysteine desulfurase family protein [Cyanobacteriota bacterium SKYGB_h_bin112]